MPSVPTRPEQFTPTDPVLGLTPAEAAARRAAGQGNGVHFQSSRSYVQILRENAFTFINTVLFGIGAVLILMHSIDSAVVTAGLVLLNVIVGVVQEGRAKHKLDQIALLTRPKATVIRAGVEQSVDPAEIVLGDLLVVRPGDQIVVDGRVIGDGPMEVDESLLTGESDHVPKQAGDPVYSGSFCVMGRATYEAQKVGVASFANQLTAQARSYRRVKTPLQHDIDFAIRMMVLLAAQLGFLLALSGLVRHIPLLESVQVAAVIVVLVPQGLFFMTTVTYATGALRMAGKGALVQQTNAIESLSNVDVLCLDKTGTLTTNRICLTTVLPLAADAAAFGEPALRELLGDFVVSSSDRNRTAQAIADACPGTAYHVVEEVPFSSDWRWSAVRFAEEPLHGDGGGETYVLGAPEVLMPCLQDRAADQERLQAQVDDRAGRGQRVLLFARAPDTSSRFLPMPGAARAQARMALRGPDNHPQLPSSLAPLGLLSFTDELRPEAEATLRGFAEAGITLKIISGDSPQTVAAMARQAGFAGDARLVSGLELAAMDDAEFARTAERGQIFGRITPHQKENLVCALRDHGHYVAMIGDGVNDVLSLKSAHLGIAMETGSQATRSVAGMVLMGDSFAALPAAFREGQRILRGMQDVIRLFLARTFYVTLLIVAASVVGTAFPLTPKHNFILALLTVGIPTLPLAAWARPGQPTYVGYGGRRRPSILLTVRHFVVPAAFTVASVALLVYVAYLLAGRGLPAARSALTMTMVLCGILLIVFVEPPMPALAGGDELTDDRRPTVLAFAMLLLYILALAIPYVRHFFQLVLLPPTEVALILGVVLAWAIVQLYIWRHNVFERLLELEL
jgi:cation-transporting P-type ATPase E